MLASGTTSSGAPFTATTASPLPARYVPGGTDVWLAVYEPGTGTLEASAFESDLLKWLGSLGTIRESRYFVLPTNVVRYEIASARGAGLEYRVGFWKQSWKDGKLATFSDPTIAGFAAADFKQ